MFDTAEPGGLPPGNYTRDTIPPPDAETASYLSELKVKAEKLRKLRASEESEPTLKLTGDSLIPVDEGQVMIVPTDEGEPFIGNA